MLRLWISSLLLCLPGLSFAQPLMEAPLRLLSFNLRYHNPDDGIHAWPHRRELVSEVIRLHEADLLGLQEVLPGQVTDLLNLLPEYAIFGVARDTGRNSEFVPICYRRSRLQLLDGGTFWLSETPEVMSRGWDAALNRIATWARFEDRRTGKQFFFFNTHLDHRGREARIQSAHLLLARMQKQNPQRLPVFLSGDFNAEPGDTPYRLITQDPQHQGLYDARERARSVMGPEGTWAGFQVPRKLGGRIDYVFYQHNVAVLRYATLTDGWGRHLPSDHLPVLVEALIDPPTVLPQAHSHNDYQRREPLKQALALGINQVEVDIWLNDGRLYVSHDMPRGTATFRYLESLYLEPLARRAQAYRGRVHAKAEVPFCLMLDLKGQGEILYRHLRAALAPYRWMTEGQHPVLLVLLTGDRPLQTVFTDPDRFMTVEGRPGDVGQGYPAAFMPAVSQRYAHVLQWRGQGNIPDAERERLRALVQQVHAEEKRLRLCGAPENEAVWQVMLDAGVDVISTDKPTRLANFLRTYQPTLELGNR